MDTFTAIQKVKTKTPEHVREVRKMLKAFPHLDPVHMVDAGDAFYLTDSRLATVHTGSDLDALRSLVNTMDAPALSMRVAFRRTGELVKEIYNGEGVPASTMLNIFSKAGTSQASCERVEAADPKLYKQGIIRCTADANTILLDAVYVVNLNVNGVLIGENDRTPVALTKNGVTVAVLMPLQSSRVKLAEGVTL